MWFIGGLPYTHMHDTLSRNTTDEYDVFIIAHIHCTKMIYIPNQICKYLLFGRKPGIAIIFYWHKGKAAWFLIINYVKPTDKIQI